MELKVGMYVRFNDLTNYNQNNIVMIDKIKFISEIMCGLEETLSITFEKYNEDVLKKDIIKASENIIDLIEVGDYVNGKEVLNISEFKDGSRYIEFDEGRYLCKNYQIESIVTKEMFDSVKYEVE